VTSRDFAARQVVLVNNMQFKSISDQLIARSNRRRVLVARQDGPHAHEEGSRSSIDENARATSPC
jgi:hypothetical protein